MREFAIIALVLGAQPALACDQPVCLADPETLGLSRIITFDDTRASPGPGHPVADVLQLDGAAFAERFAGQSVIAVGDHDRIEGDALGPLVLMPGDRGRNLSIVFFNGNKLLNGYGVAGFPKRNGQGEGAISLLFDEDQSALSFQLRGGEAGEARVAFLARDGQVIAVLDLPPAGEHHYGFLRAGSQADIAGLVVTNTDPEGIALDNLRFGRPPDLS